VYTLRNLLSYKVLSIDEEPELLEKEIAIMEDTDFEYLVGFIGYFVHKRQVAVRGKSLPLTSSTLDVTTPFCW